MFKAEELFLWDDAVDWSTQDRLKLQPLFDTIDSMTTKESLGGTLGIKRQLKLKEVYTDWFYDVYVKDPKQKASDLLLKLSKQDERIYMKIMNDDYHLYLGKYPLARITYGFVTLGTNLTFLFLKLIDTPSDDLNLLVDGLLKEEPKPYLNKEVSLYAKNRNVVWIRGTNILICDDVQTIKTLHQEIGGEIREYQYKHVIKKDRLYVNVFITACKRTFPVIKDNNMLIASKLTSLYHLSLDIDNPNSLKLIKHFWNQEETEPTIPYGTIVRSPIKFIFA